MSGTDPTGTAAGDFLLARTPTGLFLRGTRREADGGAILAVEDPAIGKVLATVANASSQDAECLSLECVGLAL